MLLPARLLVPFVLALAVLATVVVISSSAAEAPAVTPLPDSAISTGTAPATRAASSVPAAASTYVVKAGDTPSGIAAQAGVAVDALLQLNAIDDASSLRVGQRLQLPR